MHTQLNTKVNFTTALRDPNNSFFVEIEFLDMRYVKVSDDGVKSIPRHDKKFDRSQEARLEGSKYL